jgi:8-oxo-dGTP pyrophosphatase MutT (NUDIX family)
VKTRTETSAGGVAFRLTDDDQAQVALILTHEGRWQLPKGWIEDGEATERTAVREVREEAGIDAELVGPLGTVRYQYISRYEEEPARIHKQVHFYLLRYTGGSTDDHDDEVQDARWLPIEEALTLLAFKDERRIVALARDMLQEAMTAPEGSGA